MAVLSLVDLVKNYGAVPAVRGVSLTVHDGELLCILGPSGCGKSTTLRVIGGFEDADDGDVLLDGTSIIPLPPNRRPTAMIFQKYTLWPHMRVFDNVAFGLRLRRMKRQTIERKAATLLELVGLPQAGRRFPTQLSGGEQQRIALARALVLEPRVLLLDEPLSNLDARLRVRMREEIKRIQQRVKITSVFVTHDQEEALSVADRIAVMNRGLVEQIDTPAEMYERPHSLFVVDFIGRMNLLDATYVRDRYALQVGNALLPALVPDGAIVGNGARTVAIRPEDLRLVESGTPSSFAALVDVVMDLGHYRQIALQAQPFGTLMMILGKETPISSGDHIELEARDEYLIAQKYLRHHAVAMVYTMNDVVAGQPHPDSIIYTAAGRVVQLKVHRCLWSGDYPENSLAAIEECFRERVARAEIDISMLGDGDFVVAHHQEPGHASISGQETIRFSEVTRREVAAFRLIWRGDVSTH